MLRTRVSQPEVPQKDAIWSENHDGQPCTGVAAATWVRVLTADKKQNSAKEGRALLDVYVCDCNIEIRRAPSSSFLHGVYA